MAEPAAAAAEPTTPAVEPTTPAATTSAAPPSIVGLLSPVLQREYGANANLVALLIGAALALVIVLVCQHAWKRGGFRCQSCITFGTPPQDEEAATSKLLPSTMVRSHMQPKAPASAQQGSSSEDARDPFKYDAPPPQRSPNWSLQGRVALVTGGSKGLGRAIVEELLDQGCDVLTCARDLAPLADLQAREPKRLKAVKADVSTSTGRTHLLTALRRHYSFTLDILVNNVGTNLRKPSEKYSDAEYDDLCATNQGSAFHLSRGCFDALRPRKGCIINVSSVSGSTVDSTGCPYHMNKAALEHMTRCAAGGDNSRCQRARAPAPRPALPGPPALGTSMRSLTPPFASFPPSQVPGLRMGPSGHSRQRRRPVVHQHTAHRASPVGRALP